MKIDLEKHGEVMLDALNILRTGLAIFDGDDKLVYCNEQFRYFFMSFEEVKTLVGLTYEEILHLILSKRDVASMEAIKNPEKWVQDRLAYHGEAFSTRTDRLGDGRWIDVKERRTPDGGVIVQWTDATERLRFDMRLRNAVECIGDGFGVWDQSGRLELFNDKFAEHHACADKMRPRMAFKEVMEGLAHSGTLKLNGSPEDWVAHRMELRELTESQEIYAYEDGAYLSVHERKGEDGSSVVAMTDVTELKNKENELIFRGQTLEKTIYELEMSKDILEKQGLELVQLAEHLDTTRLELKAAQDALQKSHDELEMRVMERTLDLREEIEHHKDTMKALDNAKEDAELANRSKSEFLANMSHELRTPLNAIIGFSEITRQEMFGPIGNPKYLEYSGDMHDSGRHLLELVNDILDMSAAEFGKIDLQENEVSLSEISEICVRMLAGKAHEKGVDVVNRLDGKLPKVRCDARRIRQVLINLLSNAVKFTEDGGKVEISAEVVKSGSLSLKVSDNGIGMDEEGVIHALTPFGRVGSAMISHQQTSSTGLGVPLSKKLVEAHEGIFEIESEPGKGTTIIIRLPAKRVIGATSS